LVVFLAASMLLFVAACDSAGPSTKEPDPPDDDGSDDPTEETEYDYTSDYEYNLNVIYFKPSDVENVENYHERLSGFMLYVQDYYEQWTSHWGYGDKTFGLLTDEDRIKITHIEGDHPVSEYPNDGGGFTVREEVRDYFESNPDAEPDSKHYMVFMPEPNWEPEGGLPYYGIGRWSFVVDVGQNEEDAPNDGGGAAHELGHALNLPHNAHRASRRNELGAALMHNGNNVWNNRGGATATSLTEASAAILNVNQVFNKDGGEFYQSVDVSLRRATGTHGSGSIRVTGSFDTDAPVNKAVVLFDPAGGGNYDRVEWTTPVIQEDSFSVTVPYNELPQNQNVDYGTKVWLIHDNGQVSNFQLTDFAFEGGTPDINFRYGEVSTLPKDAWSIESVSDEEPTENSGTGNSQVAENVIDNDFDTFWHSRYSDGEVPHPHTITVDMGAMREADGFQFVQREAISPGAKRVRLERFTLEVSDDGSNWDELGTYTLDSTGLPQQIALSESRSFRYFRVTTKSSVEHEARTSLAEVGVYQENN
jgi:hypothetical protein